MSRGSQERLGVVLRLRTLVERRRLAEAAEAARAASSAAREHRERTVRFHEQAVAPSTTVTVEELVSRRLDALALGDDLSEAHDAYLAAVRDERRATARRTEAGVRRRSVERLAERRTTEAARLASRRSELQLDAAALERWRRQR